MPLRLSRAASVWKVCFDEWPWDLIVEFAGQSDRVTEGEFMGQMLQKHPAGEKVKATVLRGGQRVELMMPMQ